MATGALKAIHIEVPEVQLAEPLNARDGRVGLTAREELGIEKYVEVVLPRNALHAMHGCTVGGQDRQLQALVEAFAALGDLMVTRNTLLLPSTRKRTMGTVEPLPQWMEMTTPVAPLT